MAFDVDQKRAKGWYLRVGMLVPEGPFETEAAAIKRGNRMIRRGQAIIFKTKFHDPPVVERPPSPIGILLDGVPVEEANPEWAEQLRAKLKAEGLAEAAEPETRTYILIDDVPLEKMSTQQIEELAAEIKGEDITRSVSQGTSVLLLTAKQAEQLRQESLQSTTMTLAQRLSRAEKRKIA